MCVAAVLMAGALPVMAADEKTEEPASLFQQENLTGDWFGYRKQLENAGVQFGADEIFDALANPVGGQKQGAAFEGRFEIFTNIDLGAAFGWHGALLHANAYLIHGNGLSSDDVGNLLTISNIGATPGTRLFSLWLQQSFLDDALSVRAGQIAADDEFFVSQYASLFLNSTFGWPSILGVNLPSGGPAYPLATPGLRVRYAFSPALILSTAVINGDPAPDGAGNPQRSDASGTNFRLNGGLFWISELAYSTDIAIGGDEVPGTYKIGGWLHTDTFSDRRYDNHGVPLASPESDGHPHALDGNNGFYFIADQAIWHDKSDPNQTREIDLFFRAGNAQGDRSVFDYYFDGGITFNGLISGRPSDVFGVATAYGHIGSGLQGIVEDEDNADGDHLPIPDFEQNIELTYTAQVAPWWTVEPDLQVLIHPGGSAAIQNAVVLGVRTVVTF